jgi:voltage-gated potassium channel
LIEGWSWFDALYATVTTLTTIGGGEPTRPSTAGRALTLGLITLGVGGVLYTLIAIAEFVLEGHLGSLVGHQRMQRRIKRVNEHFVLCGFGRVGREIAQQFSAEGVPFVVIDLNQESLREASERGYTVIFGNAAQMDVLKEAGIERARGLVAAVDNDADNVYVTLSARVLCPELFIVARANEADAEPKLRLAGANRIISPYTIGGRRMANLAMRPTAVDFVDTVLSVGSSDLLLEDLNISPRSAWIGRTIGELPGAATRLLVLAISRQERLIFQPPADTELKPGDELVVAGPPDAVRQLERVL